MTITLGGTEVSSITIDGTSVQEVTIDGSVVWTATRPIAETGRTSLSTTIDGGEQDSISFNNSYNNPVVVAYVPTRGGGQSYCHRVKDVTSTGCTIFAEEPDNQGHATETVCYLVVESGSWVTPEGVQIEAGIHTSNTVRQAGNGTTYGDSISYSSSFSSTPVVLATLNTYNNNSFMATQVNSVGSGSFKISQERAETSTSESTEDIAWVAVEAGSGSLNGNSYEAGRGSDGSNDGVDDNAHRISLSSFSTTPDIVVHGQTMNGNDGYWARGDGTWNSSTVDVYAEEDQEGDSERGHANETFGWFAIEPNSTIIA